jgi:CheY-like chemotaxis protein
MFMEMASTLDPSLLVAWAPRVLVADPDEVCRRSVQARLQKLEMAVDAAGDAGEAFELCAQWPYVAVFMDCGRPAVDGQLAARAIRSRDSASRHALLVAVTAYPRHACLAAGMDHHVAKPLGADDLSLDGRQLGLLAPATEASAQALRTAPLLDQPPAAGDPRPIRAEIVRRFLRRTRRHQPELWRAINAQDARALAGIAGEGRVRAAAAGATAVAELFDGLAAAAARRRFAAASSIELELRRVLVETAAAIVPSLAGRSRSIKPRLAA